MLRHHVWHEGCFYWHQIQHRFDVHLRPTAVLIHIPRNVVQGSTFMHSFMYDIDIKVYADWDELIATRVIQ